MIPAILSVVFVIYLYQSLRDTPDSSGSPASEDSSAIQADELLTRLKALQSRVEQLAKGTENKEGA
jgi:sugar phosphate permease